jgi:transaldolase
MKLFEDLSVKIFADGADEKSMLQMYNTPYIKGLTTNPTLMRQAGVEDYRNFCRGILETIKDKPISFEVFSDDFDEMKNQALEIASWASNVYVKVPVTNTKGETSAPLVKWLSDQGVKVNVTAVFTERQIEEFSEVLNPEVPSYLSVFAGRIADTGVDPVPVIQKAVDSLAHVIECEVIWASPRELLNVFQADAVGCQVITVTSDILKKLSLTGKDLNEFSLETVQMFYDDASAAGYSF